MSSWFAVLHGAGGMASAQVDVPSGSLLHMPQRLARSPRFRRCVYVVPGTDSVLWCGSRALPSQGQACDREASTECLWLKARGSGPIPRGWGWSNHRCQSWNNPLLECISEALGTVFWRAKSQASLPALQGLGQHIWKGLGLRL